MADENTENTEKSTIDSIKEFLSSESGLATAIGLGALFGGDTTKTPSIGYQGSIPDYTAVREAVPGTSDTTRRPGSGGRRYFSDIQYIPQTGGEDYNPATALSTAQTAATTQATGLETLNKNNPAFEATPTYTYLTPTAEIAAATAPASTVASTTQQLPNYYGLDALTKYLQDSPYSDPYAYIKEGGMATGGVAKLSKGKYLDGKTDGMADEVPARIDGVQEARLSDGEFVIPADVVSHLGNGNSDAGAKVLESMMARVRKARTGSTKQGKEINPRDFLPA